MCDCRCNRKLGTKNEAELHHASCFVSSSSFNFPGLRSRFCRASFPICPRLAKHFSLPRRYDGVWFSRKRMLKWSTGERYAQVRGHDTGLVLVASSIGFNTVRYPVVWEMVGPARANESAQPAAASQPEKPESPTTQPPVPPPRSRPSRSK